MKADRDISKLKPNFRAKVEMFLEEAHEKWFDIFVTEWLRTRERQMFLFWKWRSVETLKKYWVPAGYAKPHDQIVTKILNSPHMRGESIDIAWDVEKYGSLFPRDFKLWESISAIGKKYGMDWWYEMWGRDKPHFQDNWIPVEEYIDEAQWFYEIVHGNEKAKNPIPVRHRIFEDPEGAVERISSLPIENALEEIVYLMAALFHKANVKFGWHENTD